MIRLSLALRNALEALRAADPAPCRFSNHTSVPGRCVYWQSAARLADLDLVTVASDAVSLTDRARALIAVNDTVPHAIADDA